MHWLNKFHYAFRGLKYGVQGQTSFIVHVPAMIAVIALATFLGCTLWQWCILLLCISLVLSLEYFNSAIELLAKGLCQNQNEGVGKALDTASAAVMVGSTFSALIGSAVFIARIVELYL